MMAKQNSVSAPKQRVETATDHSVLHRLLRKKFAVAGLIVFLLVCLITVFASHLTVWDLTTINPQNVRALPSSEHPLGTDMMGRDLLTNFLYGGRTTLRIAFMATLIAAVTGSVLGLFMGYFGGKLDFILSLILGVLTAVPVLIVAIFIAVIFGVGQGHFMYAIAIAATPHFARLVRASVMNIVGSRYIEAAHALGVSHFGIISRHVLPNIASPLIVRFTTGFAEAILACTLMGFVGIRPIAPEWGAFVFAARTGMFLNPTAMIVSCGVIAITVISISIFGDGLRDALDPRE
jgi:peptide/nickel transport system permease protein